MNDSYNHLQDDLFYTYENIMGPEEESSEYNRLLNEFNAQLLGSCRCKVSCSLPDCLCLVKSDGENYETYYRDGQVQFKLKNKPESAPIFECNTNCPCPKNCSNRVVQSGPLRGLEIKPCDKGFGLFTKNFIPKGTFVCEYAGELITTAQALSRHQNNQLNSKVNYIFCLKEVYGESVSKTFVDPSVFGNIGRYINHSCEPNCHILPVRYESPVPKLSIFALVDISPGEEITFHYGSGDYEEISSAENKIKCLCNTKSCTGFLPFQNY